MTALAGDRASLQAHAMVVARVLRDCLLDGEHWLWQGYTRGGYGRVRLNGRLQTTHVVLYEALVGPVPDGCELDHFCEYKNCCSPGCLEPVTHRENVLRGSAPAAHNARKTRCPNGHPYDYVRPGDGGSECRRCSRARSAAWKAARA